MATVTRRSAWWDTFMGFLSYVAVIFIGIALLISSLIAEGSVTQALDTIALLLSVIVVGFLSFFFAARRAHNRIWWLISWAVAVTLIVVAFILGWV